jgi:hypothetical protein
MTKLFVGHIKIFEIVYYYISTYIYNDICMHFFQCFYNSEKKVDVVGMNYNAGKFPDKQVLIRNLASINEYELQFYYYVITYI